MAAVNDICTRGILLRNGLIECENTIRTIIDKYLTNDIINYNEREWNINDSPGDNNIKLRKAFIVDQNRNKIKFAKINEKIGIFFEYMLLNDSESFTHGINLFNSSNIHLFTSHDKINYKKNYIIKKGNYQVYVWIPENLLQDGIYTFSFAFMRYEPFEVLLLENNILGITVIDTVKNSERNEYYSGELPGLLRPKLNWEDRIKNNNISI